MSLLLLYDKVRTSLLAGRELGCALCMFAMTAIGTRWDDGDQSMGRRMIAAIVKAVVQTFRNSQRHIVLVLAAAERDCIVFEEYQHRHWDPVAQPDCGRLVDDCVSLLLLL
jgi:hypothetical protein